MKSAGRLPRHIVRCIRSPCMPYVCSSSAQVRMHRQPAYALTSVRHPCHCRFSHSKNGKGGVGRTAQDGITSKHDRDYTGQSALVSQESSSSDAVAAMRAALANRETPSTSALQSSGHANKSQDIVLAEADQNDGVLATNASDRQLAIRELEMQRPLQDWEREDRNKYNLVLLLAAVGISMLGALIAFAFAGDREQDEVVGLAARKLRLLRKRATGAQQAVATRFDLVARGDGAIEVHADDKTAHNARFRKQFGWRSDGGDTVTSRLGTPIGIVPPTREHDRRRWEQYAQRGRDESYWGSDRSSGSESHSESEPDDGLDGMFLGSGSSGGHAELRGFRQERRRAKLRRHVVAMDAGPGSASDPDGTPVATAVLLAGDGETAAVWGLVQAALVSRGYRCIALHGQSAARLRITPPDDSKPSSGAHALRRPVRQVRNLDMALGTVRATSPPLASDGRTRVRERESNRAPDGPGTGIEIVDLTTPSTATTGVAISQMEVRSQPSRVGDDSVSVSDQHIPHNVPVTQQDTIPLNAGGVAGRGGEDSAINSGSQSRYAASVRLQQAASRAPRKTRPALLTGAEAEEVREEHRNAVLRSDTYRSLHLRTSGAYSKASDALDAMRALRVRGRVVIAGERFDAWGALLLAGLLSGNPLDGASTQNQIGGDSQESARGMHGVTLSGVVLSWPRSRPVSMSGIWLDLPRAASMFPHYSTLLQDLQRVPVLDPLGIAQKAAQQSGKLHASTTIDRLLSTPGLTDKQGQLSDLMLRAQFAGQDVLQGPDESALRELAPRIECGIIIAAPAPSALCASATPSSITVATRVLLDDVTRAARFLGTSRSRQDAVAASESESPGIGIGIGSVEPLQGDGAREHNSGEEGDKPENPAAPDTGYLPIWLRVASFLGLGRTGGSLLDDSIAQRLDDLSQIPQDRARVLLISDAKDDIPVDITTTIVGVTRSSDVSLDRPVLKVDMPSVWQRARRRVATWIHRVAARALGADYGRTRSALQEIAWRVEEEFAKAASDTDDMQGICSGHDKGARLVAARRDVQAYDAVWGDHDEEGFFYRLLRGVPGGGSPPVSGFGEAAGVFVPSLQSPLALADAIEASIERAETKVPMDVGLLPEVWGLRNANLPRPVS